MAATPSQEKNAQQIIRGLRRIVRAIHYHSRRMREETGLTVPQVLCLRAILEAERKPVSATDVARAIKLSPATVTGILDRLERQNLIKRTRVPEDRRKVGLELHPSAIERLDTMPRSLIQDRVFHRLLELSEPRQAELLGALEELADILDASELDASPVLAVEHLVGRGEQPEA